MAEGIHAGRYSLDTAMHFYSSQGETQINRRLFELGVAKVVAVTTTLAQLANL